MFKLKTILILSLLFYPTCHELTASEPVPVFTGVIKKNSTVPAFEVNAVIKYPEITRVATEIPGKADKVFIEEGRKVRAGEILVKLNSDILEKERESQQALYDEEAANNDMLKWELERFDTLLQAGDIPLSKFKYKKAEFLKSSARLRSLEADLQKTAIMIDKMSVRAPFSGIITSKPINEGSWVEKGSSVAEIAATDVVDIIASVPAGKINLIHPGSKAIIKCGDSEINAGVFSVLPKGDPDSRTFPVIIRINNEANLMGGMNAKAIFTLPESDNSFIISRDAVISRNDKYSIFIAAQDKAKQIDIKIIEWAGKNVIVKSPELNESMKLIIRGNQFLTDGQAIIIKR